MGIRVHKIAGYGLTNVKVKDGKIVDPRFSKLSVVAGDYEEREESFTMEGYISFLLEKKAAGYDVWWELTAAREYDHDFLSLFCHNEEYGLANVFCCIPVTNRKEWYRYDNSIDYFEETNLKKGDERQVNRVEVSPEGFYPWDGYCDSRDGRVINSQAIFSFKYNERNRRGQQELNKSAIACGFESAKECKKFISPLVPSPVRNAVEYGKVFTNPNTIHELKPMVYTYWG